MVKQSSCLTFIEKFQNHLKYEGKGVRVYDFENAEIHGPNVIKEAGHGCDYVQVYNCTLVIVECKKGRLSINDFEDAKKQLQYSIEVIMGLCGSPPNHAIICYEKIDAFVVTSMRRVRVIKLKHNVVLKFSRLETNECYPCQK